jgi:hypothetical protein
MKILLKTKISSIIKRENLFNNYTRILFLAIPSKPPSLKLQNHQNPKNLLGKHSIKSINPITRSEIPENRKKSE